MSEMKKILVIAPHGDDDILAFGGYLIDEIAKGAIVYMRYGTVGGVHKLQNYATRMAEVNSVMKELGVVNWKVYYKDMDAMMDTIPQRELATMMDADIDEIRPDELFCCYPSVHQDHIAMYHAFMITQRLRDGFIPSLVALGEYPFILTSKTIPEGGFWYHPMSQETLDKKVKLFEMYKSQIRMPPSPLSRRGIIQLAQVRGLECGKEYAEKFYLQKLIK